MDLRAKIRDIRRRIREHRDARGDDRCWLDDYLVWEAIGERRPTQLPAYDEGMRKCREFYARRRARDADVVLQDAVRSPAQWDDDLASLDEEGLALELARLEDAVRSHRDAVPRTIDDDRALYAVLPEKVPADFRLPDKDAFLGTAQRGAGCPSFWRSHASCETDVHDLHRWGPCTRKR